MSNYDKIMKAAAIAKAKGISGYFQWHVDEYNSNVVNVFGESGLYCTINIKSGKITDC